MPRSHVSWVPVVWLLILSIGLYKWMGGSVPVLDDLLRRMPQIWP
jgi:hypothetical protein